MKKTIFIILTVLSLNLSGQTQLIGIKCGASVTNNSLSDYSSKHLYRTGLSVGLSYERLQKNHFLIGAELLYDQHDLTTEIEALNYSGDLRKIATNFKYSSLLVPIKAGFMTGKRFYGFANIGLKPSIVLGEKTKTMFFDPYGNLTSINYYYGTDPYTTYTEFDISGLFEFGGGYKLKDKYWLFTSFAFQKSFTNSHYFGKNFGTTLSLGLKYAMTHVSQKTPKPDHIIYNENAMEKSKAQKRSAWVLLGSGAGIAAIGGFVQMSKDQQNANNWNFDFTGALVAIAGGVISLASIPFFISSAKYARKAVTFSISNQQILMQRQNTITQTTLPTASLKIKF